MSTKHDDGVATRQAWVGQFRAVDSAERSRQDGVLSEQLWTRLCPASARRVTVYLVSQCIPELSL